MPSAPTQDPTLSPASLVQGPLTRRLHPYTADGLRVAPSRWRASAPPALVASSALLAFAAIGLRDPNQAGHYPTCPSIALFGLHCPGCGALRGLHQLAHGDVLGLFARNALLPIGLALLAWAWLAWIDRRLAGARIPALRPPVPVLYASTAVVLLFAVLRNLPVEPFAALAP